MSAVYLIVGMDGNRPDGSLSDAGGAVRRVPFEAVLREAAALCGVSEEGLTDNIRGVLARALNRRARFCWEWQFWPETMTVEERAPGEDGVINLDGVGNLRGVFDRDPAEKGARKLPFQLRGGGAVVRGDFERVWIRYQLACPEWRGSVWDETKAYQKGARVWFSTGAYDGEFAGDFWLAVDGTAAGESPDSAPSKWRVVALPWVIAPAVAQGAYADWLRGGKDVGNAGAEESHFYTLLIREWDKLGRGLITNY